MSTNFQEKVTNVTVEQLFQKVTKVTHVRGITLQCNVTFLNDLSMIFLLAKDGIAT